MAVVAVGYSRLVAAVDYNREVADDYNKAAVVEKAVAACCYSPDTTII